MLFRPFSNAGITVVLCVLRARVVLRCVVLTLIFEFYETFPQTSNECFLLAEQQTNTDILSEEEREPSDFLVSQLLVENHRYNTSERSRIVPKSDKKLTD